MQGKAGLRNFARVSSLCVWGLLALVTLGAGGCGREFTRALREGVFDGLENGIEQQIFLLVTSTTSTELLGLDN
ncbi:MAG: hypothetical protein ACPGXK_06170 [Phycisphaerae bacterium]